MRVIRLFVPFYLNWIFRLPWWLLLVPLLFSASWLLTTYQRYQSDQVLLENAINTAPPTLQQLTLETEASSPFGEVVVGAYVGMFPRVVDFDRPGPDVSFAPLWNDTRSQIIGALRVFGNGPRGLEGYLRQSFGDEATAVQINGLLESNDFALGAFREAMLARGYALSERLIIIKPFQEGRKNSLQGTATSLVDLVVVGAIFAFFLNVTILNWRKSERREAARNPYK